MEIARNAGARCVLVELPSHSLFQQAVRTRHSGAAAKIDELTAEFCRRVDLRRWSPGADCVTDEHFRDPVHLTEGGSRHISRALGRHLRTQPKP